MELSQFRNKIIESAVGNVLMFAMNLVLPMIVSRIYGVSIYGSYVYGITMVSIAMFMANLGMDVGLLYYVPKTGKRYVKAVFTINLITSTIAIVGLYILASDAVLPYLGLVWMLSCEQLFFSLYRSKHQVKQYFITKSLLGIGGTIGLSILLFYGFQATELSIVLATYLATAICLIIYFSHNKDMFDTFEMTKDFMDYSVSVIFGSVMSLVIAYIDIVMIETMMTKADVGLYKVGAELALLPSIFLMIVNTVFPPLISKLYNEGKVAEVRRLYEQLTRYLFLISSITIAIIVLFWKPILGLYGVEYLAAKNVLFYRSFGQLINASVGSVWYIVLMTGHPKIRTLGTVVTALINVVMNYLLIPKMGIDGAALASMVATIFINVLGFFVVKGILKSKVYYFI